MKKREKKFLPYRGTEAADTGAASCVPKVKLSER